MPLIEILPVVIIASSAPVMVMLVLWVLMFSGLGASAVLCPVEAKNRLPARAREFVRTIPQIAASCIFLGLASLFVGSIGLIFYLIGEMI